MWYSNDTVYCASFWIQIIPSLISSIYWDNFRYSYYIIRLLHNILYCNTVLDFFTKIIIFNFSSICMMFLQSFDSLKIIINHVYEIIDRILSWILIWIYKSSKRGFITMWYITMVTFSSKNCVRLSEIRTVATNRRVWSTHVPHDGICTLSYHPAKLIFMQYVASALLIISSREMFINYQ